MSDESFKDIKDSEKEKLEMPTSAEMAADPAVETNEGCAAPAGENLIAGVVLVAVGLIFLVANLTDFALHNWWALFILIPALMSFGKAYQSYQANGRLDKDARGAVVGGAIMTMVASAFLFNLDWGIVWPFFLIIGGIGALLSGWFSD